MKRNAVYLTLAIMLVISFNSYKSLNPSGRLETTNTLVDIDLDGIDFFDSIDSDSISFDQNNNPVQHKKLFTKKIKRG